MDDRALFTVLAQSMAALAVADDIADYLLKTDPEGFRRHADGVAESCEQVLTNTQGAEDQQSLLFREVARLRLGVLAAAVRR